MAQKCANCGSSNTQAGFGDFQCLDCGQRTDYEGNAAQGGLDQAGRDRLQAQLDGPEPGNGIVGNLADLQRAGAAIVKGEGSTLADGVNPPPSAEKSSTKGDEMTTTKTKAAK